MKYATLVTNTLVTNTLVTNAVTNTCPSGDVSSPSTGRTSYSFNRCAAFACLVLPWGVVACADEGSSGGEATVRVLLEPEETIIAGIAAGDDLENIRDGWQVSYDKFVMVVGDIELRFATNQSLRARDAAVFVVDLTQIPEAGLSLWEIDGVRAGRWTFFYSTLGADGAEQHSSVSDSDFETLVDNDWTYLIEGSLSRADGQSCPPPNLRSVPDGMTAAGVNAADVECFANPEVSFSIGVNVATQVGPCNDADDNGDFSVASGGAETVAATIHGDHMFFNGFPVGDESGTLRLAQYFADCDLDLDGTVTTAELMVMTPADLAELEDYPLGGAPLAPDNMLNYLRAQYITQPHFQGEGDCPVPGQ